MRMHSIVLIGNCQIRALYNLYNRFVAGAARQRVNFIASYEDITESDRAAIESADVVVEQVLDFKPKADIAGMATSAERVLVPLVNSGFLWPFAGQPHPSNPSRPYLETGPYGAEMSDAWLNRMIKTGVDPETAVERYMQLDINATVNLDRLYEIGLDKQRRRDELTGFKIADIVAEHFRDEAVFRTPYHPNARIAVVLASQFFERLSVSSSDIETMRRAIRITPVSQGRVADPSRRGAAFRASFCAGGEALAIP
jgi:polysaccharide biosynthesis acetyltransferase WcbI-like protein